MECLAIAVVFGIMLGLFCFLDEKRKEQRKDMNSLYDVISRQNDRLQEAERKVRDMAETVKANDRQERRLFEGMNNILNYDMNAARKAVRNDAADE